MSWDNERVRPDYKYPCKDCVPPERHIGCHSTCSRYTEVAERNKRIRETIQKEHRAHEEITSFLVEQTIRMRRKRR